MNCEIQVGVNPKNPPAAGQAAETQIRSTKITLSFDPYALDYTDGYIAALWHAAQWNQAPGADPEACRAVERIGREIIRRWLSNTPPELWQRQGTHEHSLPAIERYAEVRNVIDAARSVVACDHGANLSSYREKAMQSVEALEQALEKLNLPPA